MTWRDTGGPCSPAPARPGPGAPPLGVELSDGSDSSARSELSVRLALQPPDGGLPPAPRPPHPHQEAMVRVELFYSIGIKVREGRKGG